MAIIDVTRQHDLGRERAREIVDGIGADLVRRYGVQTRWQGDTLVVQRAGIEGRIEVGEENVRMQARLGMVVGMLKGTIEQEIQKQFERHFG
ncbi:MAG TPA: polyhydroxyalkanoic acid system family protein [Rhodanobacteraceae bacterium]|jgi:putative polyhydroxyalkanoate system protein|nr:polyhydroxyalkanoic acid system family protein [Rhodanobacteraceae bacterium]